MGSVVQDIPPLTGSSSWTAFCLMVCRDGSRTGVSFLAYFCFFSLISGSCVLMSSDQTQITLICQWPELQRKAQKLFYLFFFLRSLASLQTRQNAQSQTTLLQPPSFVNLGCQRGLNMAVITGCYESHVSGALLPNVNDCRHRNFHDYHKKLIPRGERRNDCVHMCTTAHVPVCVCIHTLFMQMKSIVDYLHNLHVHYTQASQVYCTDCVCVAMCPFQDVSCWEAAKHQPSVPDHRCQGDVFVVWPQTATTGRTTLYPFTQPPVKKIIKKIELTLPFYFLALHPSPLWQRGFKLSIQGHTPKELAVGPCWMSTGEQ